MMKRFSFLLFLLFLTSSLFAVTIGSVNALMSTKTNAFDWKKNTRRAVGAGTGVNYQALEDLTLLYPLTYGYFINLDTSLVAEVEKTKDKAEFSIDVGFSMGPTLALDGENVYLSLSLGPAFYLGEAINNKEEEVDYFSLGLYGNAMVYLGLTPESGISLGAASYLNAFTIKDVTEGDTSFSRNYHLVPSIYIGYSTLM
ncbi:MAG: hypothetical protein KBS81_04335 [Spirochaetales bacterium]|nr:hypothetical protein [Candidatus Physcosoma equi]